MKITIRLCAFFLIIALFLCAAGCGTDNEGRAEPEENALVTVGGRSVSNEEVNYFLYSSANMLESYFTSINWEDEIGGIPMTEYIRNDAVDTIKLYYAINIKADELGCGLTDEQRAELAAARDEDVDYYGGEEAFINQLRAEGITEELYKYFNETSVLYANIRDALYGENGTDLPTTEQLGAYIDEQGYICATHILIRTIGDAGETLPEEEIEQKRALAEEIHARAESGEDFFALLDEFGEDPGVSYEPYYYNFKSGEMVEEFETAAFSLAENEISDVVETAYGFHIIKRLAIEPDAMRDSYCNDAFLKTLDKWSKEIDYTTSEEFNNIDIKEFYENFWHDLMESNPDIAAGEESQ